MRGVYHNTFTFRWRITRNIRRKPKIQDFLWCIYIDQTLEPFVHFWSTESLGIDVSRHMGRTSMNQDVIARLHASVIPTNGHTKISLQCFHRLVNSVTDTDNASGIILMKENSKFPLGLLDMVLAKQCWPNVVRGFTLRLHGFVERTQLGFRSRLGETSLPSRSCGIGEARVRSLHIDMFTICGLQRVRTAGKVRVGKDMTSKQRGMVSDPSNKFVVWSRIDITHETM